MPTPYSISDFAGAIPSVLQDSANKLYPAEGGNDALVTVLTPYVARAFERYSKDAPLEVVSDVTSDGTNLLVLPAYPDSGDNVPVFDVVFSQIRMIEYPLEQQPPDYIDQGDFRIYRSPSGYKVMLTADTPVDGDSLRFTWTARHASDGSTIPAKDFYAIVDFAASLAAETIATIYAQTSDPIMSADVVNYRTKSSEYQSLAKMLRKRYYNQLGIDESTTGAAETGPALAIGQQYLNLQGGVERLVHTKYSR